MSLSSRHYIYALSACAAVVDKPGGKETQGAVKFALALVQDLREAGWLEGKHGGDAYVLAMQTCVRAQDAWSALALLDSAQDDGIRQSAALSTAAMQVMAGLVENRLVEHASQCLYEPTDKWCSDPCTHISFLGIVIFVPIPRR